MRLVREHLDEIVRTAIAEELIRQDISAELTAAIKTALADAVLDALERELGRKRIRWPGVRRPTRHQLAAELDRKSYREAARDNGVSLNTMIRAGKHAG